MEIKYTIHFGSTKSFVVSEWLYNYFNLVKGNRKEYNKLFQIMSSIIKTN